MTAPLSKEDFFAYWHAKGRRTIMMAFAIPGHTISLVYKNMSSDVGGQPTRTVEDEQVVAAYAVELLRLGFHGDWHDWAYISLTVHIIDDTVTRRVLERVKEYKKTV